jgi:hypothetical protein
MRAWPKTYRIDDALVPAVKGLLKSGTPGSGAAMTDLVAACLAHLEARVAEPLEAPPNWKRSAEISCRCEHCAALRRFLSDPATETWTLKAKQDIRLHVEREIRTARPDLDVTTERRGSPHGLVCRKNRASYEWRVAQRRRDLADIAALKDGNHAADAA